MASAGRRGTLDPQHLARPLHATRREDVVVPRDGFEPDLDDLLLRVLEGNLGSDGIQPALAGEELPPGAGHAPGRGDQLLGLLQHLLRRRCTRVGTRRHRRGGITSRDRDTAPDALEGTLESGEAFRTRLGRQGGEFVALRQRLAARKGIGDVLWRGRQIRRGLAARPQADASQQETMENGGRGW